MMEFLRSATCLALLTLIGAGCSDQAAEVAEVDTGAADTVLVEVEPTTAPLLEDLPYDTALTLQVLALCGDPEALEALRLPYSTEAIFQRHGQELQKAWQLAENKHFRAMEAWGDSTLEQLIEPDLPLFYPFSGPDVIFPIRLFDRSSAVFLYAREPVFPLIPFETLEDDQLDQYLGSVRRDLIDILGLSYFITKNMSAGLASDNTRGVLPMMMLFIGHHKGRILRLSYYEVGPDGERMPVASIERRDVPHGCVIETYFPDQQRLLSFNYTSCNLADDAYARDPRTMRHIDRIGAYNAFLKAASYLPHRGNFTQVRQRISNARGLFQDDTGLPYRHMDLQTKRLFVYGNYGRPIPSFGEETYQRDLQVFYDTTRSHRGQLPFKFGYHNSSDGRHLNYQLLVMRNDGGTTPPPAETSAPQPSTAQETTVASAADLPPAPEGKRYRIQVLTSDRKLPATAPDFMGLEPWYYMDKGLYKYTVGEYMDRATATAACRSLQRDSFPDAFVAVFKGNVRLR
jgi:hypothetical protein